MFWDNGDADRRTALRLAEIDRKLSLIMNHLGIEDAPPRYAEVEEILGSGQTIQAIAAYRRATGAGLREAKEAVDRMQDPGRA